VAFRLTDNSLLLRLTTQIAHSLFFACLKVRGLGLDLGLNSRFGKTLL
jgi:hypothetical protein